MPSKTIKSFINEINNTDSDGGGLWLPNIQRYFVWDEDQMVKLFDSIMRQYPLPSFLIWKTKEPLRTFITYSFTLIKITVYASTFIKLN